MSGVGRYLLVGGRGGGLSIGVWGFWGEIFWVEGSPHWIFDSGPGGTESLGMLHVRSLGFWLSYPFGYYSRGGSVVQTALPPGDQGS